jgi:glutamate-1-semialdehyde aminotransferase
MQGASSMLPSPMRAGTSSSAASTPAAAAAAAAAAMAPQDDCALLDRLAEDLTSTLDRKAETEQGARASEHARMHLFPHISCVPS